MSNVIPTATPVKLPKSHVDCRNGVECKNRKCGFKHPESWVRPEAARAPDCKYGINCTNGACSFSHPAEWTRPEIRPCINGAKCNNILECHYRHTEEQIKAAKIAKIAVTKCKFGSACYLPACLFLHPEGYVAPVPSPLLETKPELLAVKMSSLVVDKLDTEKEPEAPVTGRQKRQGTEKLPISAPSKPRHVSEAEEKVPKTPRSVEKKSPIQKPKDDNPWLSKLNSLTEEKPKRQRPYARKNVRDSKDYETDSSSDSEEKQKRQRPNVRKNIRSANARPMDKKRRSSDSEDENRGRSSMKKRDSKPMKKSEDLISKN